MNFFKISKFFLFASVLCIVVVTVSTLFPFIVGKYVWFRTSVDLALIFFLLGLLLNRQESAKNPSLPAGRDMNQRLKELFKRPLVIAVSIFAAVFLLACFFGVDPKWSFWSNFERGEGGFQILHFYLFFLLLVLLFREEKDWRNIFIMMLIGGAGMALYGVLAGFGVEHFIGVKFGEPSFRFQGSIGNSAYVAAFSIFAMFYSAYILLSKYRNKLFSLGASVFWFSIALFLAVFFAAATRGAFLGLIAAIVVFVFYLVFNSRRWRKWLLGGVLFILLAAGSMIALKDASFVKSLPFSRVFDISFTTKTFADRAIMWETAINGWKERPLLGWGPENYLKIFDRRFNVKYFNPAQGFGAWFDRAHNIYLDYLAETGILGLLSFLGIWFVFFWQFFKKKTLINADKNIRINQQNQHEPAVLKALILALPVAYLVQGIVLFDVLPIYLNIFLFLAFVTYRFENFKFRN